MKKLNVVILGLLSLCSELHCDSNAFASTATSSIAVSANVEATCLVTGDVKQGGLFGISCPRDVSYSISRGRAGAPYATTSARDGATSSDTQLSREFVGAAGSNAVFVITTVIY